MSHLINLIGQKFGRLVVFERAANDRQGRSRWGCHCSCGVIIIASSYNLRNGNTQSCGCFQKERTSQESITHNMSKSPEYDSWAHIINRCNNPNDKRFKDYGGRGIKVCEEWTNSFQSFYDYVGKRPFPKYTIDRINNNGNYEPGNVRWASKKTQNNNSRRNHCITVNGITKTVAQWARFVGMKAPTLLRRIRQNWPPQKAIFTPIKHKTP